MRAALTVVLALTMSSSALAQTGPAPTAQNRSPQKPAPPQKPVTQTSAASRGRPNEIRARAFATFGAITFQAQDSFDAILGAHGGPLFGGGGQVLLPWGFYAEVGLWQFRHDGERAF